MNIIMTIAIIIFFLSLALVLRSNWVHKHRMKVLDNMTSFKDLERFDAMPSYEKMLFKFWIWDFEKLKVMK